MAKGVAGILLASVAAGVVGFMVGLFISSQANIQRSEELALASKATLDMLYQSRNVQEYLRLGSEYVIGDFVESGGPDECGSVVFDSRRVSVWSTDGCELVYSEGLARQASGELAAEVASAYASHWNVEVTQEDENFCLSRYETLPFGNYDSKVCFESGITDLVDDALQDMEAEYGSGDCTCVGQTEICWVDVSGNNFTYARDDIC